MFSIRFVAWQSLVPKIREGKLKNRYPNTSKYAVNGNMFISAKWPSLPVFIALCNFANVMLHKIRFYLFKVTQRFIKTDKIHFTDGAYKTKCLSHALEHTA